jgi:hypothetical protein
MKPFTAAAILLSLATTAAANVLVDEEHVAPTSVSYYFDDPGDYMAQTFTLRNSGQLTSIALQISQPDTPYPTNPLQFQLTRTNSAGEPDIANVLATASISPSIVTHDYKGLPMTDIDLRSQHVGVQAGDELAIVLSSNDVHYNWNYSLWFDEIAGGKFFVYSPGTFGARWFYQWNTMDRTLTGDAGYRITIDAVPEPSTTLLATLAIATLITRPPRGLRM